MKLKSKYEKENFEKIIHKSINLTDVFKNLNMGTTCGNRKTIKKYIQMYDIDISHFHIPKKGNNKNKKDLYNDILIEDSSYNNTTSIKNKLYKLGLKIRECELCGQNEEWRGKKMSLILDHINGIYNDNRLNNLRIVCPNCNATLDTHCGKHINKIKIQQKKHTCVCGSEILKESNVCRKCSQMSQRKVKNRPNLEILLNDINSLGYSKTGLKYGVSDNTIRKWIKQYSTQP